MNFRIFGLLVPGLLLTACSTDTASSPDTEGGSSSSMVVSGVSSIAGATEASSASAGSYTLESGTPSVTLSDAGITMTDSNSCISVSGTTVLISCSGTFAFTGTMSSGQIQVQTADADTENVYLVLNGVNLSNTENSPIYVLNAEKTFLVLPEGSENILSDAASYTYIDAADSAPNACVYSKDDLTIKGAGKLSVYGNFNNGIQTSNDLKIKSDDDGAPELYVKAVNNALKGKESIEVEDGTFTLATTSGDAMHVNDSTDIEKGYIQIDGGSFVITSHSDAIQAYRLVNITGGTFNITTGTGVANTSKSSEGGSSPGSRPGSTTTTTSSDTSYKGIKSDLEVSISGGTFTINSVEDAIHSNNVVNINDGYFLISGRRGIHADDTANVNGGTFIVTNSYEGIEAYVINMNGGVTSIYSTDDAWNASNGNNAGTINITGGYHYVKTPSGDTDGIDSNGDINIKGGVLVIDAGGNIIDKGDNNNTVNYTAGIVLGFGTQVEGIPSSGNPLCYSGTVSAGTRFTVAPSASSVLSTFAPTQSPSKVIYINSANTGTSAYIGGTYTAGTETEFYYGTYAYGVGGSISGGTSVTLSSCSSSGQQGGGTQPGF